MKAVVLVIVVAAVLFGAVLLIYRFIVMGSEAYQFAEKRIREYPYIQKHYGEALKVSPHLFGRGASTSHWQDMRSVKFTVNIHGEGRSGRVYIYIIQAAGEWVYRSFELEEGDKLFFLEKGDTSQLPEGPVRSMIERFESQASDLG